jgi:hypothetical protein
MKEKVFVFGDDVIGFALYGKKGKIASFNSREEALMWAEKEGYVICKSRKEVAGF